MSPSAKASPQASLRAVAHQWLLAQEKKGAFKITDPKLRETVYEDWTTKNRGAFLTDDKERTRREFLEPEWVKPPAKK